jgi:antitoxin (DNA-binding transcriptional repressor) of toxin-antitoxin stability system
MKRKRECIPETIQVGERPMSSTITVEEAQARLKELIDKLAPGEELVITWGQQAVAKLVDARPGERTLGTMRGTVRYMAPDFDAPLDDFKEYMESGTSANQ